VKADAVTKIQAGLATPTNITAGTITTATNLTNAPTVGDLTATMKTSVQVAADAAITANGLAIEIGADVDELIATVGVAGAGLTAVSLANGSLVTATLGTFMLAKTTNITGFNDIAATAVVSSGAITTSAGKVSEVTLVDTVTTNTDMRGTNNAALAATALSTATWTGARAVKLDDLDAAISTVAPAVWDIVLASHLAAGSTGFALNAAGSSGDPWGTALPGAYGAGTAGYRVGTYLNSLNVTVGGYAAGQDPWTLIFETPNTVEGFDFQDAMKLFGSVLCGTASGGPLGTSFVAMGGVATRVLSVDDASGNRSQVVLTA
jgi:hypothetical protein